MDSALLDRRVEILRQSTTTGAFNEDIITWSVLATHWARRHDVNDAEALEAGGEGASVTSWFIMRQDSVTNTVGPKDQLRDLRDGLLFDIVGKKDAQGRVMVTRAKDMLRRGEAWEFTAVAKLDLA